MYRVKDHENVGMGKSFSVVQPIKDPIIAVCLGDLLDSWSETSNNTEEKNRIKVTVGDDGIVTVREESESHISIIHQHMSKAVRGSDNNVKSGSTDHIQLIIEQTACTEEQAKNAYKKCNGDVVDAIMSLF